MEEQNQLPPHACAHAHCCFFYYIYSYVAYRLLRYLLLHLLYYLLRYLLRRLLYYLLLHLLYRLTGSGQNSLLIYR